MDNSPESPLKKKKKSNVKLSNLQCLVHIFKDEKGSVSNFTPKSWRVGFYFLNKTLVFT